MLCGLSIWFHYGAIWLSKHFLIWFCCGMDNWLTENVQYILNLLWPFYDVQEVVMYDSLQTVLFYLKMSPLCIILCLPGNHPRCSIFLSHACALLREIATLDGVALLDLLALWPPIVFLRRCEGSQASSFSTLFFEQHFHLFDFLVTFHELPG
jgi:hypothetical protein